MRVRAVSSASLFREHASFVQDCKRALVHCSIITFVRRPSIVISQKFRIGLYRIRKPQRNKVCQVPGPLGTAGPKTGRFVGLGPCLTSFVTGCVASFTGSQVYPRDRRPCSDDSSPKVLFVLDTVQVARRAVRALRSPSPRRRNHTTSTTVRGSHEYSRWWGCVEV